MDYDGLFAAAQASGNPKSFLANNYKSYGFTSSSGLYDDYKNWLEGQSGGAGLRLDMRSVNELGYGPINEEELNRLVKSGEVEEYEENGLIRFRRTGRTAPQLSTGKLW